MPIGTPSVLTANNSGTDATSYTTASFTPVAGRTIFAVVEGKEDTDGSGSWAITNTHAGTWAWSALNSNNTSNVNLKMTIFWATVPNSPGAGTITFSRTVTMQGAGWCVFEVADSAEPLIANTNTGNSLATGAPTIDLPSAPVTSSLLISVIGNDPFASPGITAGSGWTELNEQRLENPDQVNVQVQYRTGTTSPTAAWSNCSTGAGSKQAFLVLELPNGLALSGSVTETTGIVDTQVGTMQMSGSIAETVASIDAISGTMRMSGLVAEAVAPADALSGTMAMSGAVAESVVIVDTAAGAPSAPALSGSVVEPVTIADVLAGSIQIAGSASETINVTDAMQGSMGMSSSVLEIVSIVDSLFSGGLAPPVFEQQACMLQQVTLRGRTVIQPH